MCSWSSSRGSEIESVEIAVQLSTSSEEDIPSTVVSNDGKCMGKRIVGTFLGMATPWAIHPQQEVIDCVNCGMVALEHALEASSAMDALVICWNAHWPVMSVTKAS